MVTTLAKTPPSYFPGRISQYVPGMRYAADVSENAPTFVTLGTPPTEDADGVANDLAVGATAVVFTLADCVTAFITAGGKFSSHPYGVNLTMTGSSGADQVITVKGRDYLGAFMAETFTLSTTTKIIGRKAFKWVDSINVAAGGTASKTVDVGWGLRLGLPYKAGSFLFAREGTTYVTPFREEVIIDSGALATIEDAVVLTITAPISGVFLGITAIVTTAIATGAGVLAANVAGSAQTSLNVALPVSAVGTNLGNVLAPSQGITVTEGNSITFTSDGVPSAGAITSKAVFAKPQGTVIYPDLTDPATATTDDTRGTYQAASTLTGSLEIIVCVVFSNMVNSSGNGGLYGIEQYFA